MAKIDTFIGSKITTRFGNVLTVGWEGDRDKGGIKLYTVNCSVCGDGFKSRKGDLNSGQVPCNCNPKNKTRRDDSDFVGSTRNLDNGSILKVLPCEGEKTYSHKLYPISCSKCDLDKELFHRGFTSTKSDFLRGRVPCGCSSNPKWNKDQWKVLIQRECKRRGNLKLKGREDTWKGQNTKLKLECSNTDHGFWESTSIANFFNQGHGCPKCAYEASNFGYYKDRTQEEDNIYLLKFTSSEETFIKIGRGFDITKRIAQYPKHYTIEVIASNQGRHEDIFNTEQDYHRQLKAYLYSPLVAFGGSILECFTMEALDKLNINLMNEFEKELKLLS